MKERRLFTICLLLFCLGFGAVHLKGEDFLDELQTSPAERYIPPGTQVQMEGEVYKEEKREDYYLLYLKNNSIIYNKKTIQESKILLYDSQKTNVKTGNKIQVSGELFFFDEARNPGNFDQKFYYQKQNIHAAVWGSKAVVTDNRYYALRDALQNFRERWKEYLIAAAGEEDGGILSAMMVGDKYGMDGEIKELYQVNGIAHVLAISGLHLSFIGSGVYGFLRRRTGSYLAGGAAGMAFLLLYVVMIGFTVSALRALVMFVLRVGADMSGRVYDMLTSLSAAAVAVVWWQPLAYYDGGFQMSFGAILGIWAADQLKKVWEDRRKAERQKEGEAGWQKKDRAGRRQKLAGALGASLGVQAILLPVTLYHFFSYPPYSVFLNLLVIPLMSVLLVLGVAGSLLYSLFPPGGGLLMWLCGRILDIYEVSCRAVVKLPGSEIVAGRPGIDAVIFYYVVLGAAVWIFLKREEAVRKGTAVCTAMALAAIFLTPNVSARGQSQITMLDIGQGDCIFMRGSRGTAILVDGGSSTEEQIGKYRIEPFLKSQGVGKLDYVFVSHGDGDHISGIGEMLERQAQGVKIACLVLPPRELWDEKLEELAVKAVSCGAGVRTVSPGQGIVSDEWEITAIQPYEKDEIEPGNAASLVLDVKAGDFDLLLTGDVEEKGEELLEERISRTYDVLKVAHHGSKNSSSALFLQKASPSFALISAGEDNLYGHPHEDTVKRLEDQGCAIYTTIERGAVTMRTDGRKLEIETFVK